MKTNKKGQFLTGMAFIFFILTCLAILLFSIRVIDYNEYAVEREFGHLYKDVKEAGFTWVGLGDLIRVNNQIRNYEIIVASASNDYQDVTMTLNLNIKIKKDEVYNFIKNYQSEQTYNQYLNNKVQEKVKAIVLKYSAEDILNNRINISRELYQEVKSIPELSYFEFNDLVIKDVSFSPEFNDVLEKRARVNQEREIIIKQQENLKLQEKNMQEIDIDTYFKYQLIEKWNGQVPLIISDSLIKTN